MKKKIVLGVVFSFFAVTVFGQTANVVVSNFTSRAKGTHEEDLITVTEMFFNALSAIHTPTLPQEDQKPKGFDLQYNQYHTGNLSDIFVFYAGEGTITINTDTRLYIYLYRPGINEYVAYKYGGYELVFNNLKEGYFYIKVQGEWNISNFKIKYSNNKGDFTPPKQVAINVLNQNVLGNAINVMKFGVGDWSDSIKTTQLGEKINADYFVTGSFTQLGQSITFDIIARDIKTLAPIVSDRKQYTVDNIWDNSAGIPGQLSSIAETIASGISNHHRKRLQEIQAQIAKQEDERKQELAKQEAEKKAVELERNMGEWLIGSWKRGERPTDSPDSSGNFESSGGGAWKYYSLQFNANGSFSGYADYWTGSGDGRGTHYKKQLSGTWTREKNTLKMSYTESIDWVEFTGGWDRNNRRNQKTGNFSNSKNGTATISFGNNGKSLDFSGFDLSGEYKK